MTPDASRSNSTGAIPATSRRRAIRVLAAAAIVVALASVATDRSGVSLLLHAAGMAAQTPDADGDTMPDDWETFFGLDPNDAGDATADPDGDGLTNAQEYAAQRHPVGRHVRYFAEGSTGFFDTSVGLLNLSQTEPAHVAIALLRESGGVTSHRVELAPRQRQTVSINAVLGMSAAVAIVVESDVPVAADRWMTWGNSGIGATLDSGAPAPATTWYFAEGATGPFLLYYLFENPGTTPANVTIRYLVEAGTPVSRTHTLPPQSRTTVFVNDDAPALRAASVGSVITSDVPIFAERAMYVNAGGRLGGGSASAGSNALSTQWYFGEGSTGRFFQCFLSLLNPGTQATTATVTYHLSDGSTATKTYSVPAEGRRTVYFNGEAASDPALAALAGGPVWFTVTSPQPILGERAMWWPEWPWYEGHAAPGSTIRDVAWAVPGGRHGGTALDETYVLVGNTTATPGQVRLTLIPDTGAPMTRELPIGAGERLTVNAGSLFGVTDAAFSVIVESLGASPAPLAVDYARYRSVNGVPFSGGGAAPAIPVPPADAAPTVTSTTPAANATGAALDANLTVTFSEPVNAGAGAFVLECPASTPIALTNLTASPATTFTLDPGVSLPASTACRLRIVASEISDADTTDPPDELAADVTVPFTSACPTITVSPTTVPGGTIDVAYASVQFTQTGGTAPIAWTVSAGALPAGMNLSAAGLLAGTPTVSGPFSFTVTATDANTCPASVPLTLSILAEPNHAPSFTAGANQTVLEDAGAQTVAGWATGISPGPPTESGQAVTFVVTANTNPALFSTAPAVSPTGVLTYTPAANANGTATIDIVLQDNGGTLGGGDDTSDPQSIMIAVTAVNDAPGFTLAPVPTVLEDAGPQSVALATAISPGPADEAAQTVGFTVTSNSNTALFSAGPAIASDGTLTYTPAPNASGSATITMTAQDSGGTANGGADTSAPQSFTIGVTAVNDPPAAFDDAATTDEDTVLTVAAPGVLANDVDPDTGDTRTVVDVNGSAAAVGTTITLPSGALLTANADGSGSYDPRPVAAFQALGAGQSAIDSFAYTMQDALGVTSTATVTLTITGVNDAPTLDLDLDDDGGTPPTTGTGFAITFTEGAPAAFIEDEIDATIADVDSPALTTLTVTMTNVLDALQERLDVDLVTGGFNANFTKTFDETTTPGVAVLTIVAATPQPIASFNTLLRRVTYQNLDADPDVSAPRAITFVVSDGAAASTAATTTVTIQAANSPPTADNDSYSVAEGGTLTIAAPGVLDGDTDPEGDTPITAVLVAGPAHASAFTLNADGGFSYTHDGTDTPTTDTFTYQASTNGQLSNVATATITITAVNDPPTAVDDANTTSEDAPVTAAVPGVLLNDTDPDPGDTRTVSSVNGLPANVGTAVTLASGATVTLNANGSYTYTPGNAFQSLGAGQNGTDTFTYTIQDAAAAQSNTATVTLTITGVDDAPVVTAGAGSAAFTEDGAAVAVAPALTVTDADSTTLASATVQITGNYQNGQDVLAFVNQAGITGVFTSATGTLTLTGSASLASYQTALQSVTYSNTSQNPNTGPRTVTFQVNDGALNSNTSTRGVTVAAVNDAPVITAPGAVNTFTEDGPAVVVDGAVTITDPDNPNMASATVTLVTPPDGAAESLGFTAASCVGLTVSGAGTSTLTISGSQPIATYQACLQSVTYANTSQNPNPAVRTVTFVVNDGSAASNTASKTLNVVPVNDAPLVLNETFDVLGNTELRVDMVAGTTPHSSETTTGASAVEGVLDNDADPEGNPIAVTAITGCADTTAPFDCTLAGAVVHVEANGEFSYTPAPGATTGSFAYTVTDTPTVGTAASSTGTVTFTIFDMIWYVDADAAAGGNGTSRAPFTTLTATNLNGANGAGDLDDADDYIFLHAGTYDGGIELELNQHLLGEGVGLSINRNLNGNGAPTVLVAPGTAPVITNASGNSVTVTEAMPAEIRGLTLGSVNAIDVTTDAPLTGATSLTIANNTINGATAEGIDVNLNAGTTGTLALAITGNSWNLAGSHAGNAVDISRAAGTLTLNFSNNTNLVSANAAGAAVVINGGAAANTFITGFANNTIHGNTAGAGVSISNVTFDAVPATGPIDTVNGGTLTIGASGNAVGGAGAVFSPVAGSLSLADLDVFGGTSGLTAAGLNLAVSPNVGTISAANGAGVDVSTGTLDLRLSALTVTTTAAGVSLNALTAGSQFSAASGSSISKTSGGGTAFSVASSNVAMSYAGSLNVTSGSGVSLTGNNAAATFSFSGGMTLSTGTNPAFTATGGGTVSVVDPAGAANNTITTTTGVPLNVANTTIGASGLTFQAISTNGAASGIVLNATGAGGLTVTGTGAANSGGTIQNSTADGISLTSTGPVSLTQMNITSSGQSHIDATSVNGLSLTNVDTDLSTQAGIQGSNVTNLTISGGTFHRGGLGNTVCNINGVNFTNLLGTSSITGATFSSSNTIQFRVNNNTATNFAGTPDTLTVSGTNWQDHNVPVSGGTNCFGDHLSVNSDTGGNFRLIVNSSSGINTVNATNDANGGGTGVQATAGGTNGKMDVSVTGLKTSNNTAGVVVANTGTGATVTFNIFGNKTANGTGFTGTGSLALAVTHVTTGGTTTGTIDDNSITHAAGPGTNAMQIVLEGGGTVTARVSNNAVTGNFQRGLHAQSHAGTGTLNLTVNNNTLNGTDTTGVALQVFNISNGGSGTGHGNTTCLNMQNNAVTFGPGATYLSAYRLVQEDAVNCTAGTCTFALQNFTGSGTNTTDIQNWITTTKSNTTGGNVVSATIGAGFQTSAACPTP